MTKVITYGTYDMLHYGHIRLLERARALGDYLIVGVTADDFDKKRGKINVQQTLTERLEAVHELGIADEIIVEEYEGQKIDDIKQFGIDIFTVGSDWIGKFDYLKQYCKVIYLDRTEGVSSSVLRDKKRFVSMGLIGDSPFLNKVCVESAFVNGIHIAALCSNRAEAMEDKLQSVKLVTDQYDTLLDTVDAVYIRSLPEEHYTQIKQALCHGKHVLCESPMTLNTNQTEELFEISNDKNLVLMEALKTAYATAYLRLLLLIKSGEIGDIVSVDSVCTSLKNHDGKMRTDWDGMYEWGPTALLPVLQILGTDYKDCRIISHSEDGREVFAKIEFIYPSSVASIKIGDGIKSEGELIISGTKGYIYVPAPWWKTEYFEIRHEDPSENKKFFYQLQGEGIRYELVAFTRAIERGRGCFKIEKSVTCKISEIMQDYCSGINLIEI